MLRPLHDVGEELIEWASGDVRRVPTGFSLFDDRMSGGVAQGEVMLFLARTGVGKTWFALNVIDANPDTPAIFMSYEMHARLLLQRLAAVHTGVRTSQIEEEIARDGYSPALQKTIDAFPKLRFVDDATTGLGDLANMIDEYEAETGERPAFLAIDFLELIPSFGMTKTEGVWEISRAVKQLARQSNIGILLLHQVNRGEGRKQSKGGETIKNEGHRALSMTDASYGGEQLADYIVGMYRPGLDPEMPEYERKSRERDVRLQFLKTRTDGGIHPMGVQHDWEPRNGRIPEIRFERRDPWA